VRAVEDSELAERFRVREYLDRDPLPAFALSGAGVAEVLFHVPAGQIGLGRPEPPGSDPLAVLVTPAAAMGQVLTVQVLVNAPEEPGNCALQGGVLFLQFYLSFHGQISFFQLLRFCRFSRRSFIGVTPPRRVSARTRVLRRAGVFVFMIYI